MKKVIIIIIMVVLLSGCTQTESKTIDSVIESEGDYSDILELIKDTGHYDEDVTSPYNKIHLYSFYSKGLNTVENIVIDVYHRKSANTVNEITTECYNVDNELKCRRSSETYNQDILESELYLDLAFGIFAEIDVPALIYEIRLCEYVDYSSEMMLHYAFVSAEDIPDQEEKILYYKDGSLVASLDYEPTGILLEITIVAFSEQDGCVYKVYKEIEN